MADDMSSK